MVMPFSKRFARIKSRHPSHGVLRKRNGNGVLCNHLAVVRFGSTTPSNIPVEINSIEAIKNSSNKIRMKQCFDDSDVSTPEWYQTVEEVLCDLQNDIGVLDKPVLAKLIYGSRGAGMRILRTMEELEQFAEINKHRLSRWYFERYYNYTKEYRLHVGRGQGCFYTNRKMLKADTPEDQRWYRNNSNSVWFMEDNEQFDKPETWDAIVDDCVAAMESCGLDFGACDVRVNKAGDWKIIEINSAPSFGEITEEKYREVIPRIVDIKAEQTN